MGVHLFTPRRVGASLDNSASSGLALRTAGKAREAGALLLIAAALYLVLALGGIRVDPGDPTLLGEEWVGPVGGSIGRVLARGFGVVAWLLPVELVLVAVPLFRRDRPPFTSLRLAGDLVVAIVLSALVHIATPEARVFGALPSGGNVGLLFGEMMQALFSAVGSFLVGGTSVLLILIGRSQFSFIEWTMRLSRALAYLEKQCRVALARLRVAWRDARILRRERDEQRQSLPVIEMPSKDEIILAHLREASPGEDDDSDWLPIDKTGAPPIALSKALRESAARRKVALGTDDDAPEKSGSSATSLLPDIRPIKAPRKARTAVKDAPGGQEGQTGKDARDEIGVKKPTPSPSSKATKDDELAVDDDARTHVGEPKIIDTRPEREVKRTQQSTATNKRKNGFTLPSTDILLPSPPATNEVDKRRVFELSEKLEKTLLDYGVTGKVVEIHPGPTVTTYEVAPEAGTKVSKIASLVDDLALGLSRKVRIVAPIPGKSRIGFEIPNDERQPVNLRELVEDKRFYELSEKVSLPCVLGRDIVGAPFYADLAAMPHVIVAGATGAGKSVGLNVMLGSLLFRRTPDELRLLMIDPKVVELAPFDGIPHMLLPVVTDMKQAAKALKWAVDEMERRYQMFANAGTKNIGTYNRWVKRIEDGEIPAPDAKDVEAIAADGQVVAVSSAKEGSDGVLLPGKLPFIVIVVDEFADLMMQQGKDVEVCVARLAQKARAAGMHVILATQRPSVDVITGMIKANFPTRIAFRVAQKVDSRTILDEQGAELLLGKGDMLAKMNGANDMRRVQCPFVSEEEIDALTSYLRTQGTPTYHDAILEGGDDDDEEGGEAEAADPRFDEAVRIVGDTRRCSTSWLQRKMTIGYNRAAKMVEMMEKMGMVGPPNGARDREVLISPQ
jgi:S-DNA-T family DNA segregation ATPase FtsK/SpoIIIE